MISIEIKGKIQNGAGGTIGSGGQKLFKSNQIQLNRTKIKWWNIEKESENVVKVKLMNKNKEEREREMMMMMTLVRESESERVRERQRDRDKGHIGTVDFLFTPRGQCRVVNNTRS